MKTVAVFCFMLAAAYCEVMPPLPIRELEWWEKGCIYQIYPRSFQDSDDNGVGDLKGIAERVDYLAKLGITGVWLSPIYPSPMADFGYDISDYRSIDPTFGTMEDFKTLEKAIHSRGLKFILDYVPNHTSDEPEWFKKSVKKEDPYTDYYLWVDAKMVNGKRTVPNNWLSDFEGSAWAWNEERQQYYLHKYHPKQPDLNYRNPKVVQEMKDVLTFWMDQGVDGFRMDAVMDLVEDAQLRDEPRSYKPNTLPTDFDYDLHIYTRDQPETYEIIKQFRKHLDNYSAKTGTMKFMAAEAYSNLTNTMKYYGTIDSPGAHFPFNFKFIKNIDRQSNATKIKQEIESWYKALPERKWSNWVLGNHDNSRVASRFGVDLLDGLHMLQMVLQGTSVSYMGDEIGMADAFVRWDQTLDPVALNSGPDRYLKFSRDPARSPFQWSPDTNAGFSTAPKTWLPLNPSYWQENLQEQKAQRRSHLKNYLNLLALKKSPVIQFGNLNVYDLSEWLLVVTRALEGLPTYVAIVNLGTEIEHTTQLSTVANLPEKLHLLVSSVNSLYTAGSQLSTDKIQLRPKAAVVCSTEESYGTSYETAKYLSIGGVLGAGHVQDFQME